MTLPPLSYSAISLFETCPRKYEAEKVTKEVKFTDNQHTLYGKALHEAAENFIAKGTELAEKFQFIHPQLEQIQAIPGEKFCEIKMGLKKADGRLTACDFFDKECYFRGVADLFILNGIMGYLVDYKTSKNTRYADLRQLALMAACLFAKFPQLKKIKAALLFVVPGELIKSNYTIERKFDIFGELHETITRMTVAHETGVFNPTSNGLCGRYCDVLSCENNGKNGRR